MVGGYQAIAYYRDQGVLAYGSSYESAPHALAKCVRIIRAHIQNESVQARDVLITQYVDNKLTRLVEFKDINNLP